MYKRPSSQQEPSKRSYTPKSSSILPSISNKNNQQSFPDIQKAGFSQSRTRSIKSSQQKGQKMISFLRERGFGIFVQVLLNNGIYTMDQLIWLNKEQLMQFGFDQSNSDALIQELESIQLSYLDMNQYKLKSKSIRNLINSEQKQRPGQKPPQYMLFHRKKNTQDENSEKKLVQTYCTINTKKTFRHIVDIDPHLESEQLQQILNLEQEIQNVKISYLPSQQVQILSHDMHFIYACENKIHQMIDKFLKDNSSSTYIGRVKQLSELQIMAIQKLVDSIKVKVEVTEKGLCFTGKYCEVAKSEVKKYLKQAEIIEPKIKKTIKYFPRYQLPLIKYLVQKHKDQYQKLQIQVNDDPNENLDQQVKIKVQGYRGQYKYLKNMLKENLRKKIIKVEFDQYVKFLPDETLNVDQSILMQKATFEDFKLAYFPNQRINVQKIMEEFQETCIFFDESDALFFEGLSMEKINKAKEAFNQRFYIIKNPTSKKILEFERYYLALLMQLLNFNPQPRRMSATNRVSAN